MTRTNEVSIEVQASNKHERVYRLLEGKLAADIAYAGGILTGVSIKITEYDVLLTLRAEFPGGPQVAFCGASDMATAFLKAGGEVRAGVLRWRQDRYRT